jgi:hypothetical protein
MNVSCLFFEISSTVVAFDRRLISRDASRPRMVGMLRSIVTRSGLRRNTCSIPSSPEAAWPTM